VSAIRCDVRAGLIATDGQTAALWKQCGLELLALYDSSSPRSNVMPAEAGTHDTK
jgi:hypothetical protein